MKSQIEKRHNIFKFLPIIFLLFGAFALASQKTFNERAIPVSATSEVYGEFSLPDQAKWIYIHSSTGSDTVSRTGRTLNDPLKTFNRALQLANDGDAIMLLSSFLNLNTAIVIEKNVIIASSPTDANGVPINYVHSIERSSSATNDMFRINAGGELHLAHVVVHGKRTQNDSGKKDGSLARVGSNNPENLGKLYLHPGSQLRGGNRTLGGSAVLLMDGVIYMNGGEVRYNYTPASYTLIGPLGSTSNNKFYFISGEVSNNTSAGNVLGIRASSTTEVVIGADFIVKDNVTHEAGELLPHYGAVYVKIINNFTERRKFYATGMENYELTVVVVDENFIPLETQPEVLMFYESYNDSYLYPHYINGKYIWKYFYNENFSVITQPTATTTGLLARKAHIDNDGDGNPIYSNTNYIDEVVLPILNTSDYQNITLDTDLGKITYEYVHEGETFVLTYDIPTEGFVWRIIEEPSLTSTGMIVCEHPNYPGVIFETSLLPILSTENYVVNVTNDEVIYSYVDEEGLTHDISVDRPEDGYSWEVNVTPTTLTEGSATLIHPDFEGVVFATTNLPKLDSEDYVVSVSGGEAIHSYYEENTNLLIIFAIPLPEDGFVTSSISSIPTKTESGMAVVTHPSIPRLEVQVVLPELTNPAYNVEVVGENAVYSYVDPITNHTIVFTIPLPENGYEEAIVKNQPTATTGGTAIVNHPDLPGVEIEIELPKLDDVNYDITVNETNAVYTYTDAETGFKVDVIIEFPNSGYNEVVIQNEPSPTTDGKATVTHPDLPGVEIEIELPKLNGDDYVLTVSGEYITYAYTDQYTNVDVEITFALPSEGYSDPVVVTNPTTTSTGKAIITHPDLPGFEIEIILPELNIDDYDVKVEGNEVIYMVTNENNEEVEVRIPLPEDGYKDVINEKPSATETGTAIITHPDLPGAEIEIVLPELNGDDYDVSIVGNNAVYIFTDDNTGHSVEVVIELPETGYNQAVVQKEPSATETGTAIVTHPNLPGVELKINLPALNSDDYDIRDNGDGTLTYILKDTKYGVLEFSVLAEKEINLWWIIIIELVLIVSLIAFIGYKHLLDKKKKEETKVAVSTLPLLFFVKYIPNGAILIIIILAVILALLSAYLVYSFIKQTKGEKIKEETSTKKTKKIQ
ncbi:MAG: hypothetical protein GX132_01510 [Erysipelotrichia bacterium]|jgi:hypothetical protein|nr:hypothetical protein [Erysipelotrichia bacterium]